MFKKLILRAFSVNTAEITRTHTLRAAQLTYSEGEPFTSINILIVTSAH